MADRVRILTSPVRTTGGLPRPHVAALVAADAVVRWAVDAGCDVEWAAGILAADLAGQYAVERELAREAQDRASLGREEFRDRARALEAADRARAIALLDLLRVSGEHRVDSVLDDERVLRAARTAFVRLYDAGLLERAERVVATCPRCATVVDDVDAEAGQVEAEAVTLKLSGANGAGAVDLEVELIDLELLLGVVAVVVPESHPAAGADVEVPLAGRSVPVIAEPDVDAPRVVVPAHDAAALVWARHMGLAPVEVLGGDGTVRQPGPLAGLGRYAARAAAREMLAAAGDVVGGREATEECGRCRRCGTIVVPHLGWHWFLAMAELETAAADAVREGGVEFSPPAARGAYIDRAGQGGDWCLSHQVWSGFAVPAGRCLDCNQVVVAADLPPSCGKCMGEIAAADDVLDARFLGAVWPLAIAGWPDDEGGPHTTAGYTTLLVGPTGLAKWALPMAALGVRLAGAVPFSRLSVHPDVIGGPAPEPDVSELLANDGTDVTRFELLAAESDFDAARALVAQLVDPPPGSADVEAAVASVDAALAAASPATAVAVLAGALAEGIPAAEVARLRHAAVPLLGATVPSL